MILKGLLWEKYNLMKKFWRTGPQILYILPKLMTSEIKWLISEIGPVERSADRSVGTCFNAIDKTIENINSNRFGELGRSKIKGT